ncbi:hypothetical protein JCM19000A_07500 [Silvimonas sp. JCM 19000]
MKPTRLLALCAFALFSFSTAATAAPDAATVKLAQRYVAVRSDTFKARPDAYQLYQLTRRNIAADVAVYLKQKHPEIKAGSAQWQNASSRLGRDEVNYLGEKLEQTNSNGRNARYQAQLAAALAQELSAAQLNDLLAHYQSALGKTQQELQTRMSGEVFKTAFELDQRMASGELVELSSITSHEKPDQQLLNTQLLDYWAMTKAADESWQQTADLSTVLLLIYSSRAILAHDALAAQWQSVPASERQQIQTWQQTPLAQAERIAIYRAAKACAAQLDLKNLADQLTGSISDADLDTRWAKLLPAR